MTNNTEKKFPLTVAGMYSTSGSNSRSAILTQEAADRACAAIQAAVGGKLAIKATKQETRDAKLAEAKKMGKDKSTFPDYFLEAVTPDLLAEERARMAAQNGQRAPAANFAQGDDAL